MKSGLRSGKEQDLGLNRISCPYFVPSIAKLDQGSRDIGGSFTLSIGSFGYSLSQHFEYCMYRDLLFLLYVILV
ncbi:Peptide chain release factor 2 [Gossypium arboreum]|uniref:Peptide chain release factor 2 n=1 Tax=Gossypium arboreum TaxID=29729 RepID=A0A0B0PJJ2_GOSAR|nr:Peptide chain release factor 2 [Gossypium arboreum]